VNTLIARARIHPRLFAYATVLVAYFLRVYRLADKNVWWDEGWSIWLARQDLAAIALRTAADEHPPLHYWLLHFWNAFAGTDAFAGRFLSVAFGVLTVTLLYRIGARVGGAWLGALAALFLAIARFHIWWSQDIKNYTPSIFFAFAAVWFALRILDFRFQISDSPVRHPSLVTRHVVLYALCAALALWTHYLAGLVLLALNVYALGVFIADKSKVINRKSNIANWLIANLAAAALFAPWLALYLRHAAAWTAAPTFDFALFLKLVATVLPLGVTTNIENYAALTMAFTALVVLGGFANSKFKIQNSILSEAEESKLGARAPSFELRILNYELLFVLIVVLPPILIYLLSLTPVSFFAPKIQARYLLVLLPAYVILLALGIKFISRFGRPFAAFVLLFVFAANAFVLSDYYADRRLRDEYTTLANTLNAFARQGDLVLLDTDQEWPTFLYYLRAPLDWLGAPNGKAMDAGSAAALIQRARARHDAVWLVAIPDALATDPQRVLEARLARELPEQFEQTFGDKRLALYAAAPRDLMHVPPENFAPQFARGARVNDNLQLLGYDLPVREARAGDTLRLVTYWQARKPDVAQINAEQVEVPAGERVRVQTNIAIPPQMSGDFAIGVSASELARVRVEPRAEIAPASSIAQPVDYRFGDAIHLVGYDLPATKFRAGASVPITLHWRADRPIETSYTVFVHLVGEQFNPAHSPGNPLWGQVDRIPRDGAYPTTAWLPNETVPDAYRVPIDTHAPAGTYKIEIGLYDPATGARLAADGGADSAMIAEIVVVP